MTNLLKLVRALNNFTPPRQQVTRLAPRRQRRQEERDSEALLRSADRIKLAQVNSQKKAG